MAFENGEWVMRGLNWNDPQCIHTWKDLIAYVNEVGFLPLFANDIPGFSVEEHVSDQAWFNEDPDQDPWEWRVWMARSGGVAYGKFFEQKSGFVSLDWFSVLANYRRNGYDFDSRWDDELASVRQKKIMDQFEQQSEWVGLYLKRSAGFGKNGEKNFSGIVTELQMQTYLVIRDFRCKINKRGGEYGMPVSVYTRPEDLWGYDMVTSAYREAPEESGRRIRVHLQKLWPQMTEKQLAKIVR